MKYKVMYNVFEDAYRTETNPDGVCYVEQTIKNSYAEAKAYAYAYLMYILGRYYETPPEDTEILPLKGMYPNEMFCGYIPFEGFEGYIQHLKGGDIYTFIVPVE